MAKNRKNRKADNKANRQNAQNVNPFEQFLMQEYSDVIAEAYARYQTTLETQKLNDDFDAFRQSIQTAETAKIVAAQNASNKAVKIAAAQKAQAICDEKFATIKAKLMFAALCVLPVSLAVYSLAIKFAR